MNTPKSFVGKAVESYRVQNISMCEILKLWITAKFNRTNADKWKMSSGKKYKIDPDNSNNIL